jgi:hypothetical protein
MYLQILSKESKMLEYYSVCSYMVNLWIIEYAIIMDKT